MGIADRVNQAQAKIAQVAQQPETATAKHAIYWRPSELDRVRDFAGPNFLNLAEMIRGAVRFALAHEQEFLDFLRAERSQVNR
jgi:hypothetical protein